MRKKGGITCDFCNRHVQVKAYGYTAKIGNVKVRLCSDCAEKEKDKIWDVSKYNRIKKEIKAREKKDEKRIIVKDWRMESGKKRI